MKYLIKLRQIHRELAVMPADGACKKNMISGWELTCELPSKWIIFQNTQAMVPAKLHGKRLRIDVWIDV